MSNTAGNNSPLTQPAKINIDEIGGLGDNSLRPMINPSKPNQVAPAPQNPGKKPGIMGKMWNGVKSGTKKAVDVRI